MDEGNGMLRAWKSLPRTFRMLSVGIVGGTVVAIGVAMLVLPGPGLVVLALGLAILASEFEIARVMLAKVKKTTKDGIDRIRGRKEDEPEAEQPTREMPPAE